MPVPVDMEELISLIGSGALFLVDVYAAWCHPCRLLDSEIEALEGALPDLKVVKVDYDSAEGLSDVIPVRALPLLVLFHNGKEILRMKGFQKSGKILEQVREALPGIDL